MTYREFLDGYIGRIEDSARRWNEICIENSYDYALEDADADTDEDTDEQGLTAEAISEEIEDILSEHEISGKILFMSDIEKLVDKSNDGVFEEYYNEFEIDDSDYTDYIFAKCLSILQGSDLYISRSIQPVTGVDMSTCYAVDKNDKTYNSYRRNYKVGDKGIGNIEKLSNDEEETILSELDDREKAERLINNVLDTYNKYR